MFSQARVILLNYKRKDNVDNIVKVLSPFIKITVINNNPSYKYYSDKACVENFDTNHKCLIRWKSCFNYDEPFKIILDDDFLISPESIKSLIDKNKPISGIMGYNNVNNASSYSELRRVYNEDSVVDFLVGSVICVKQDSLEEIEKEIFSLEYLERGDDILISYLLKNKLNITLNTYKQKIIELPQRNTGLNKEKHHFIQRWKLIDKFKKLGWT